MTDWRKEKEEFAKIKLKWNSSVYHTEENGSRKIRLSCAIVALKVAMGRLDLEKLKGKWAEWWFDVSPAVKRFPSSISLQTLIKMKYLSATQKIPNLISSKAIFA